MLLFQCSINPCIESDSWLKLRSKWKSYSSLHWLDPDWIDLCFACFQCDSFGAHLMTGLPRIHRPINRNSDPSPALEWHCNGRCSTTTLESLVSFNKAPLIIMGGGAEYFFMSVTFTEISVRFNCSSFLRDWMNPLKIKSLEQYKVVNSSSEHGRHISVSSWRILGDATGSRW